MLCGEQLYKKQSGVKSATLLQEANRAAMNRMPPLWALAAMAILGANEFLAVLYNPLWLAALIILFLFARTVYIGVLPRLTNILAVRWSDERGV